MAIHNSLPPEPFGVCCRSLGLRVCRFTGKAGEMNHSVQSFVEALRRDGIDTGRKAAEDILRKAEQEAQRIVQEAESRARKIIADSEQQRRQAIERTRSDLELAARDTVARLRDTLGQAIDRVLAGAVSRALEDVDFLKELIGDIVAIYAKLDAIEQHIDFNVSEDVQKQLAGWVIGTLQRRGGEHELAFELHGALTTAGFEYKLTGGTVEITPDSVRQVLSQIVTPEIHQLMVAGMHSEP